MIQKLMLAGAFIHEPKILFLDEPFIGLDPIYQYKVQRYLDRYITRGGTIFICTHILELAEKICTRVAIINKGRIVAIGKLSEMRRRDDENLTEVFMRIVENHMNLNFFSPAT
jgi:ABC-2 type transport system ATP-binding protein